MENRFDVNIAGYTLTVRTDRSAEHMERLGGLVNEAVREIQKGGTSNYLHVILLAAIKLADEVLELRGERDDQRVRIASMQHDLLNVLNDALGQEER